MTKRIIKTKGRDSKYSSKRYYVTFEESLTPDLDDFFGKLDEVKRDQQNRKAGLWK